MGRDRVGALLKTAEVNLERAEKRFKDGEYDTAVFHASMAVEGSSNALIIRFGGSEAKNHRAVSGLATVIRRTKPEWKDEEEWRKLISMGRSIEREVVYARYPLKIAETWMTPMEYYTKEKAEQVIKDAKFIVSKTKEYFKRLN